MLLRIKNNAKYIFTCFTVISSIVFGLLSILQMFVNWDIFGVENDDTKCKITIFCIILVGCMVLALIQFIFFSNSKSIFLKDGKDTYGENEINFFQCQPAAGHTMSWLMQVHIG